jgi:ribose transport system permease protein
MTVSSHTLEDDQDSQAQESATSNTKSVNVDRVIEVASKFSLVGLLILFFAFFSLMEPDTFLTVKNVQSMAAVNVVVALLAIGVIFPLIVGEFDLSVGYTLGLSQAFVIGMMTRYDVGPEVAIPVVLVGTTMVGILIGVIVAKSGIHSLIVTLAAGSVMAGLTQWYTGGSVLFDGVPTEFPSIARKILYGIPLPVIYLAVALAVAIVVLERTPLGRKLYGVGGNRTAAALVGIRVDRLLILSFAVSGFCAGAAGVVISSRLASAQPGLGPDFLLPAYAAAFLGATAIRPGRFNPLGVVVAVYLLAVATTGLGLMGVPKWAELVFNGAALLIAVWVSMKVGALKRSRAEHRYRDQVIDESESDSEAAVRKGLTDNGST